MGDHMVRAEGLMVQRHSKKPGKSQRFIPATMLEMPAKDLRSDVDAKYDLSEGSRLSALVDRWYAGCDRAGSGREIA
jgi:hypothetical protein